MKLHTLIKTKKRIQRVGRGGKRGHTAGRGTKGQKSRSGRRLRPAERDLILRIPKRRGYQNKVLDDKTVVLNIGALAEKLKSHVKSGTPLEVTIALLKTMHLLGKNSNEEVKILSTGEIEFPITVQGISVSESAKKKIEKAGGTVKAL